MSKDDDRSRRSGGRNRDDSADDQGDTNNKKKFTGRCRLFIGNLVPDVKETEIKELIKQYGEVSECFISSKGFGFVRLDTRAHAEATKEGLDGYMLHGRAVRVRFAVHGAALRLKELSPYVSNELLFDAFSAFGTVERAVHIVDEKGRPTGDGIVEFERKPAAAEALKSIEDGVFLLTASPRPIIAEAQEARDEDDGLQERMIPRTGGLNKEREQAPRMASQGTFEYEFGNRWKELYQMEKVRREQLEQELRDARERLEGDMDLAYQDYQAQLMREDLRRRQEELERLEAAKRDRMDLMRRREEERIRHRQETGPPPFNYGGAPPAVRYGGGPPPPVSMASQGYMPGPGPQGFGGPGPDGPGMGGPGPGQFVPEPPPPHNFGPGPGQRFAGPPSMQQGFGPGPGGPGQGPSPQGPPGQQRFGPPGGPPRFAGPGEPQQGFGGPQGFEGQQDGQGQRKPDEKLVSGVQRLLQMFKGGQVPPGADGQMQQMPEGIVGPPGFQPGMSPADEFAAKRRRF